MRSTAMLLTLLCLRPGDASAHALQALPAGTIDLEDAKTWAGKTGASLTEFDVAGVTGKYSRFLFQGERRFARRLVLGGVLPAVSLESSAGDAAGLGNPLLYGDYVLHHRGGFFWTGGLAVGLPSPEEDEGLGTGHPEFVPRTLAAWTFERPDPDFYVFASAGFHLSAGGEDHHAAARPLLVSPHEDKEFLFDAGIGVLLDALRLTPELSLGLEQAMDGADAGRSFLSAALHLPYERVFRAETEFRDIASVEAGPYVGLPLTRPARFQWTAGAAVAVRF